MPDRIVVYLRVDNGLLSETLSEHRLTVAEEVLAVRLDRSEPPAAACRSEFSLENEQVVLGAQKVSQA